MTETPQQRIERIRRELQESGVSSGPTQAPAAPQAAPAAPQDRVAEVRARAGVQAPQAPGEAPPAPKKTFMENAAGVADTVFGGGTIGEALGNAFAKNKFRNSAPTGPSAEDRERAEAVFRERTGKDIDFSQETERKNIEESTFKGPSATAIGADVVRAGLSVAPWTKAAQPFFKAAPILTGAGFGGAAGVADAVAEGKDAEDVVKEGLTTAAIGGAIPIVGSAVKGAFNAVRGAGQKAAETATMARSGIPDARTATVKVTPQGTIVPDKTAREVIRQGVPAADVASIKTASASDKKSMLEMLAIRTKQQTMRTAERATDVVGKNFVEKVAKPIQTLNRQAGERLNQVAMSLSGKKVNPAKPVAEFAKALEGSGIKFDRNGNIKSFIGSDFEGLRSVQGDIKNVWLRLQRAAKTGDAHQMHRLKSYIDTLVEYGAEGRGLQGRAATLLKGLRHEVDTMLDTAFPAYNKVNTQFADTIKVMEQVNSLLGRKMRLGDEFADARMGVKMRALLSNSQSRSEIMKVLKDAQTTAGKYGVDVLEDIERQAYFADMLERLAGTEAPTSLLGQAERAIGGAGKDAAMAGAELLKGNAFGAVMRGGKAIIEGAQGINLQNQLKAIEALLREGAVKAGTNFGRVIK